MLALAVGKTYLTAGGYVVEIIGDDNDNGFISSERTAPGVTALWKRTCLEINKDPANTCKDGWYYEPDGSVNGLTAEWTEKLKIVEELPFPIPELPEGYAWADGYPQFREIKKGEYYVNKSYHNHLQFYNKRIVEIVEYKNEHFSPSNICSMFGTKRFAVVKATPSPEPTKTLDPLVEKYGEPEAGWRWLADDEKVEKGDEFKSPSLGYFVKSDNWGSSNNKQAPDLKPYRRKIMIQSQQLGDPIITNHPQEAQVGEWVEVPPLEVTTFLVSAIAAANSKTLSPLKFPLYYQHKDGFNGDTKYVKRINESQYTVILKENGKEVENEIYTWDKRRDQTVAEGTWIEVPEAKVNQFITSFKGPEESKQLNFPVYYKSKKGFSCDTKYIKRTSKEYYCAINNKGVIISFHPWTNNIVNKEVPDWIEVPEKEVLDFIASVTVTEANSTLVKKEEEKMNKENFVKVASGTARFAGNWGFKAANYWLFEPAANLGRPIVKGVRYAVFLGSLSAAVYGYNHPEVVKNAIKSCIPKITIEAPEVLKG